ncbi:MAG: hypothetical protein RIE77_09175 [Phycisphaerales bacterium]|jgi:hypothetical protein
MAQTLPRRTVVLRHDLPDGSHHFDWMLETDADGPLLTFRLDRDISQDSDSFVAEPIGDHRRRYLDYEGPISGDRGSVTRIAEGRCDVISHRDGELIVRISLGNRDQKIRGNPDGHGRVAFRS